MAWFVGLMGHMDPKKYPKTAESLWEGEKDMTIEQWKQFALAVAENAKDHKD